MSCEVYQKMIDRGWRRSGTYCYKPDLRRSCCPQYTIRLDALKFKPSRSQRQLVHRWNRFVLHGDPQEQPDVEANGSGRRKQQPPQSSSKGKAQGFILTEEIHAAEHAAGSDSAAHTFEVIIQPSSYTEEKFKLYQSYQLNIHHEAKEGSNGFKRFLVESPLHSDAIPYPATPPDHLPRTYGSYHQLYRVDGELIAMGVIDVLPFCVSSVYFMYEKKWERFSLGKLSALREASLAREIHDAGAPEMTSLYMGFYIHSCPKMRYKADYSPSYLADPEDYTWFPLEKARPILDKYHYATFSHPEHAIEERPNPDIPNVLPNFSLSDLREVLLLDSVRDGTAATIPVVASSVWKRPGGKRVLLNFFLALGIQLCKEVILYLRYELEGRE